MLKEVLELLQELTPWSVLFRTALSLLFGGCIGLERGYHGRAAGLRTHILVCLGACMSAMIGLFAAWELGFSNDPLRVGAQVVSGIGFLGVGTIIVQNHSQVTGLTTAAGLWATAAIGLAMGFGLYAPAIFTVLLVVVVFTLMARLEFRMNRTRHRILVYLEIDSVDDVRQIVDVLTERFAAVEVQVTPPRSGTAPHVGVEALIRIPPKTTEESKMVKLQALDHVVYALRIP